MNLGSLAKSLLAKIGLKLTTGEYSLELALKKAIKRAVQLGIAYLVSRNLGNVGVNIAVDPEVLTGAIYVALEPVRNYLKQRLGLPL